MHALYMLVAVWFSCADRPAASNTSVLLAFPHRGGTVLSLSPVQTLGFGKSMGISAFCLALVEITQWIKKVK